MRATQQLTILAVCGVIAWTGARGASAQGEASPAPRAGVEPAGSSEEERGAAGAFGTGSQDFWVAATQFMPSTGGTSWTHQGNFYWSLNGTNAEAQVNLPAGAFVTALECFVYDADASDISVSFWERRYNYTTDVPAASLIAVVASSGTAGYQKASQPALDRTLRYRNGDYVNIYTLMMSTPTPSTNLRFRGCRFAWHRQVTAAPAAATFPNDVPTSHPFFRYIEALAAAGITGGCGTGAFCPDTPVTRGQMAVFLAGSLGLHWPY